MKRKIKRKIYEIKREGASLLMNSPLKYFTILTCISEERYAKILADMNIENFPINGKVAYLVYVPKLYIEDINDILDGVVSNITYINNKKIKPWNGKLIPIKECKRTNFVLCKIARCK